ncbi:MAG: HAD hydrolase-like protein [Erysipelotrichia bacterium]|nr:HAD hydrolase-like protein [Erysipelotrichia bacterium]
MKYKCLVFDHDDTIVNSTATIHYPCFQEYLNLHYPGEKLTLDEYFRENFTIGFLGMCQNYHMTAEQIRQEEIFWKEYVQKHIPNAYPGIKEIMQRHKEAGVLITVVSHSLKENILRDFKYNHLPQPDLVYGWELPNELRKPSSYPLEQIMQKFSLQPEELLVIDDAKPGYDMARKCHVKFAAVGWANSVVEIEKFMRQNCDIYLKTIEDLDNYLKD